MPQALFRLAFASIFLAQLVNLSVCGPTAKVTSSISALAAESHSLRKNSSRFRKLAAESLRRANTLRGLAAIGSSPPTCLAVSLLGIIASRQRSCDRRLSSPPSDCASRPQGDTSPFLAACRARKRRENRALKVAHARHPFAQFYQEWDLIRGRDFRRLLGA